MTPRSFLVLLGACLLAMAVIVVALATREREVQLVVEGAPASWPIDHLPILVLVEPWEWRQHAEEAAALWEREVQLPLFVVTDAPGQVFGGLGIVPVIQRPDDLARWRVFAATQLRITGDGTIREATVYVPALEDVPEGHRTQAMAHELGHVLGLGHDARPWSVMAETAGHEITFEAVSALRASYLGAR